MLDAGQAVLRLLCPGAVHGPHHVFKKYVECYKGKFDQGWDKLNQEIYARQKQMGVIPANADLPPLE